MHICIYVRVQRLARCVHLSLAKILFSYNNIGPLLYVALKVSSGSRLIVAKALKLQESHSRHLIVTSCMDQLITKLLWLISLQIKKNTCNIMHVYVRMQCSKHVTGHFDILQYMSVLANSKLTG